MDILKAAPHANGKYLLHACIAGFIFALSSFPASAQDDYAEVEADFARVAAAPVDVEYGEYLAGECSTCHAATASLDSGIPRIAGRDREELIRAMVEYRTGYRENQVMRTTLSTKGDDEIAALAGWFAQQD